MKLFLNTKATYDAMTKFETAAAGVAKAFAEGGYSLREAHAAATEWAALSATNMDYDSYTVSDEGKASFVSSHPDYQKMVSRRRSVLNLLKGLPARGKTAKKASQEVDKVEKMLKEYAELSKREQARFLRGISKA